MCNILGGGGGGQFEGDRKYDMICKLALHNRKLHNSYLYQNIIRLLKSRTCDG
jgi:hypothetical protein